MADECNDCGHNHEQMKLDGSYGTGDNALLTIITTDPVEGEKRTTYEFPYELIDFAKLQKFAGVNLIAGYQTVRRPKAVQQ